MAEKCGVVVVAAGTGSRLGRTQHKALVDLSGRPLFLFCLEIFSRSPDVEEVVLVVHPDDQVGFQRGELKDSLEALGVSKVVAGGARRQDSVLNGLRALAADCTGALVHDAARPFLSPQTIHALTAALERAAAAVPVVPATSTVKEVGEDGFVVRTVPRKQLRLAQTPQAARKELLIAALEAAERCGSEVTDDVQAMEAAGHRVVAVPDTRWNFKVTTPEDLKLAEIVVREGLLEEDNT